MLEKPLGVISFLKELIIKYYDIRF